MTGGGLNRDFAGKVTVVTGAGSGIGRATALLLARLRAKVHVSDLDGAPADAVRAEIEAAAGAGRATADAVDVTDPTAVESLAGRVFAEMAPSTCFTTTRASATPDGSRTRPSRAGSASSA